MSDKCFICGTWGYVECGHYMKRANTGTRWNFDNARPLCRRCNSEDDTKKFREKLVAEIGEYRVKEVERKSRLSVKLSKMDLKEMIGEGRG